VLLNEKRQDPAANSSFSFQNSAEKPHDEEATAIATQQPKQQPGKSQLKQPRFFSAFETRTRLNKSPDPQKNNTKSGNKYDCDLSTKTIPIS